MTTALNTGIRRVAARLDTAAAGDGELLAQFLTARDEAAFAAVVRRHGAMVFGTCRRVLGNAADADDAFQAAFVVLVRKAHSLTDRPCVGNFLYGVAYHTALKARAMAAKRRAKEATAAPPPAPGRDPELTRVLDEELAKLPEKYRGPVVLCELEGVGRKDAAARLGVPEGTLSSRLATAHRMLAKRLAARGFAAVSASTLFAGSAGAVPNALFDAAVHAATAGPSPGVAHIVSEVTKMLLFQKLKTGTAVLATAAVMLGVGFAAVPKGTAADDKPAPKADTANKAKLMLESDEAKKLQGRWVSRSVTSDPPPPKDVAAAVPTHVWTFDGAGLKTESTVGRDVHTAAARYVLNPQASPKELNIVGDKSLLLGIYELTGDKLKVAFYGRSEVARPKGFAAKDTPKDADPLTVIEFTRETDRDRLQGHWQAESLEAGGAPAPGAAVTTFRLRFHGDNFTLQPDGRTHTFAVDEKATPKAMDLTPGDGTDKGKRLKCAIYELKGDTLKLCIDKEGVAGKRPTEFKTAANDGYVLIVLKRVKADAVKP